MEDWNTYDTILLEGRELSRQDVLDIAAHSGLERDGYRYRVLSFLKEWFGEEEYLEFQTSGSTGAPKIIRFHKRECIASALQTIQHFELKRGNSALLALPMEFVAAKMMVVRAIVGGLNLLLSQPTSVVVLPDDVDIDFAAFTPHQLSSMMREGTHHLDRLRKVILGGAAVSTPLTYAIHALGLEWEVYETYGMTETLTHIAVREIFPKKEELFRVLRGVTIGTDSNGALSIGTDYLTNASLQTNDVVRISDVNGIQGFEVLGRVDHVINSGGVKVQPERIERILQDVCQRALLMVGMPDDTFGQRLELVIEGDIDNELEEKILCLCEERLPRHMHPRAIHFVPRLVRTKSGKIQRTLNKSLILSVHNVRKQE